MRLAVLLFETCLVLCRVAKIDLAFWSASWYAPRQNSSFQLTKRASHLTTLNSKQPLDFRKDKTNNITQEARLLTWYDGIAWQRNTFGIPRCLHKCLPTIKRPNSCKPRTKDTDLWYKSSWGGIHPNPNSYHALTTNACQSHFLFPLSRNIDPVRHTLSILGWPQQIPWTAGWSSSRVSVVCTQHV